MSTCIFCPPADLFVRLREMSNVKPAAFMPGNKYDFAGKPTWRWSSAWTRPTLWGRMRRVWVSSMGTSYASRLTTTYQNLMAPSLGLAKNTAWTTRRYDDLKFRYSASSEIVSGVAKRCRVEKHPMVLWRCAVCRQRHQAYAEFWKNQIQEDLHWQAVELHHPRHCHLLAQHVPLLHSGLRLLGEHDWLQF